MPIALDLELNLRTRSDFADHNLQIASRLNRLAVYRGHHITLLQTCVAGRRAGSNRSDQRSAVSSQVEELRVLRSYVVQANSKVSMVNHTVFDQGIDYGMHSLGRNGEAGAGERSGARDEEGVNADQLTVRVDQRATGVAGVDGSVCLNKVARLAGVIGVRILAIDRAHDAASHREPELPEGIANRQHRLSGDQLGRVAPTDGGQILGIDFNHGQICKLVSANYPGRKGSTIVQGYTHVHGAVDDVVVGHDVAIRRNDHTAANAVFDLALALSFTLHAMARLTAGAKKPGEGIVVVVALAWALSLPFFVVRFGSYGNVDHGRRNPRGNSFGRLVKGQQGVDAGVVDGRDGIFGSSGSVDVLVAKDEGAAEHDERESKEGSGEALHL